MYRHNEWIKRLNEENIKLYDISNVQPNIKTDISYYQALKKIEEGINKYGDCKGLECLRSEFANYYNEKIGQNKYQKENIQITNGASDAIISLLMAICDEGDTIIILEPFFYDYKTYCKMLNIDICYMTIEELKEDKKIPSTVKGMLFSNPNNPSGNIFNEEEMEIILKFANKKGLYIISDEVYSEVIYEKYISFASLNSKRIIVVDSVSKKFNNCGARIGAIITKNKKIINDIIKIYDTRIAMSNTEQIAVTNMFKNRKAIFKENLKQYKEKKCAVEKFLQNQKIVQYEKPKGGIFLLLTLPVKNTDTFAEWLVDKFRKDNQTVLILPASGFYKNNKNKIRLSIANSSQYTIEALKLLFKAIEQYKKEGYL